VGVILFSLNSHDAFVRPGANITGIAIKADTLQFIVKGFGYDAEPVRLPGSIFSNDFKLPFGDGMSLVCLDIADSKVHRFQVFKDGTVTPV
jgi:hypothetical protein